MGCLLRSFGAAVGLALAASVARADEPPPLDLAKVEGIGAFPGGAEERARLARDGFVVLPRLHKQIFSVYVGSDLPYYVTCDSAHDTYQVLFESALKEVERGTQRTLRDFVLRLANALATTPPTSPRLREGYAFAIAHAEVARRLLGEPPVDRGSEAEVDAEVTAVEAAAGPSSSAITGEPEDYAVYRPRGFYAGDPALERYFRAVTWLGRRGFRAANSRETAAALLVVRAIRRDEALRRAHEGVEAVLGTLLGPADDLTVSEYAAAIERATKGSWDDAALEDVEPIRAVLAALRDPEVNSAILVKLEEWKDFRARTKGLRLMPSRVTADGRVFQALLEADPKRRLPGGLEVAASLGSARAATHVGAEVPAARLGATHYDDTLRATAQLFDVSTPLLGAGEPPAGAEGTPLFPAPLFRGPAWHDRLLATGLASWSGLRHAWVLHAKSFTSYGGLTDDPPGVVEPAPRYYAALGALARGLVRAAEGVGAFRLDVGSLLDAVIPVLERIAADEDPTKEQWEIVSRAGPALEDLLPDRRSAWKPLFARLRAWRAGTGALSEEERAKVVALGVSEVQGRLERFAELADWLAGLAEQELRGVALSEKDVAALKDYGKTIAGLQGWESNSWLSPDKQMGWIVDVALDPRRAERRLVGVGAAMELYVALPLRGGATRLHRGGVYLYVEFSHTVPLTDEEWRRRVEERTVPPAPAWTRSYIAWADVAKVVARIAAGETVEEIENVHDVRIGRALLEQLKAEPRGSSEAEQDRQAWLLREVAAYAEVEMSVEVGAELLRRVLRTPAKPGAAPRGADAEEIGDSEAVVDAAVAGLARFASAADRAVLVGMVVDPPAGSVPEARGRLVEVLQAMEAGPTPAELEPLLTSPRAEARQDGVELLLGVEPSEPAVERAFTLLDVETEARVVRFALREISDLRSPVDRRHAPRLARHLASPDAVVRGTAVALLGTMRAASEAERIFPLLKDRVPEVAAVAGEALAEAVRGSPDAALVARTADALARLFRVSGWSGQASAVRGLGQLGGPEAAAELGKIATNPDVDPRMRGIATEALGDAGEAAIPHLFRLAFDETPTGNSTNSHAIRVCDVAVEELDDLLDGKFGWSQDSFGFPSDEEAVARVLAAVRAEARRLGHAPK